VKNKKNSESVKQQVCIRMTPTAYELLTKVANKFKTESARGWNNSAIVNLLVLQYAETYLPLKQPAQDEMFENYCRMRGDNRHTK